MLRFHKLSLLCVLVAFGCTEDVSQPNELPETTSGKTDVFGRALVGAAAPYDADLTLSDREEELKTNFAERRKMGWDIIQRAIDPVPLLGVASDTDREGDEGDEEDAADVPSVPRFQTWYGVDDFKRMFEFLHEGAGAEARRDRVPFSEEELAGVFEWNAEVQERSNQWPIERYLKYVEKLGVCWDPTVPPEECAQQLQSNFSGGAGGNARITYSPATILHLLRNYGAIVGCLDGLEELSFDATPSDEENFTYCFEKEFPKDAVLVKAQWARVAFGKQLPVFDTDAEQLNVRLGPGKSANWGEVGDRQADPGPEDIFTIRLRNKDVYRLSGLHVMTKELRHWTWVTMWWSDTPDSDFGEDRPDSFENFDSVWSNYKMCVVVDYEEGDPDPAGRVEDDYPSLAAAVRAQPPGASWCSNPYVEHGRGNAASNCIGCHQHGGSQVGPDLNDDGKLDPLRLEDIIDDNPAYPLQTRQELRQVFPADYLWSFNRVDNLRQVIRSNVDRADIIDGEVDRTANVLAETGEADVGELIFGENCARCHGADGMGGRGPSLFDRVPMRDDETLADVLLQGLGPVMPAWGTEYDDRSIADILAYLVTTFDPDRE